MLLTPSPGCESIMPTAAKFEAERFDSIDLDLLNTGHGLQQRKMHGDLRREVLAILERVGSDKGVRYTEVAKALNEQSSIPIEASELTSVIKVSAHQWLTNGRKLTLICRNSNRRARSLCAGRTISVLYASSSTSLLRRLIDRAFPRLLRASIPVQQYAAGVVWLQSVPLRNSWINASSEVQPPSAELHPPAGAIVPVI